MIAVDALVVVAMADEEKPFLDRAASLGPLRRLAGPPQRVIVVGGRTLLLVRSGIGLVNAAVAATAALASVQPAVIISAGSAGGIGQQVRVGDVIASTEAVFATADATAFGYELGQVPGMPARLPAAPPLVAAAVRAAGPLTVRCGPVLSSDAFVDARTLEQLRTAFPQALSTDMESAALAQVAHLFGLPFVSVRAVSDLCGPTAGVDHTQRVDDAAERSAAVVLAMLADPAFAPVG